MDVFRYLLDIQLVLHAPIMTVRFVGMAIRLVK